MNALAHALQRIHDPNPGLAHPFRPSTPPLLWAQGRQADCRHRRAFGTKNHAKQNFSYVTKFFLFVPLNLGRRRAEADARPRKPRRCSERPRALTNP